MKLEFLDLKTKQKFKTDKFKIEMTKNGRKMAVAIAPSGAKSVRFVKKDFKM